jgi:hypothetical protein
MYDKENDVARLKRLVQDQYGTSLDSLQLFMLGASSKAENATGIPLCDNALITKSCSVALCAITFLGETWK